jgi:hypothetical protein
MLGGVAMAGPALADTTWDFPSGSFTLTDIQSGSGTATINSVRITGTSATGTVNLTNGGRSSCSTSTFSGLVAVFSLDGQYNPCHGTITFSVDSAGVLNITDSSVYIPSTLLSGPSKDSVQGTKYPPEIACTATPVGSSEVTLAWRDSGSGATQYGITASPSLPQLISITAGPNQTSIAGLQPGTKYTFTLTVVGPWTGSTTCDAQTAALAGPVGTVTYGVITGTSDQNAQCEYTLSSDAPPPGWSVQWLVGALVITPHGSQPCGTTSTVTPQWIQAGLAPIPGAPVTIAPKGFVATPVLDPYPSSRVSGNTVTVNYSFPTPFAAGTTAWAMYRLTATSTPLGPISLGSPPAGGSSGSASFTVAGLKPPKGVEVQLYATNGPITSVKGSWQTIPGGATTTPTTPVVPMPPPTPPSGSPGTPTVVGSGGTSGASTGAGGGSSGSVGSGGGSNPCLAPNGTLYVDFAGSVGSTLTMAPNTFGLPVPQSFTVTKGSLPAGVRLDGTYGVISGTPERSNGGNGAIEITTTWPDGAVRASDFNIAIDDPHHAVNYPNRIVGSVGQPLTISPLPINAQGPETFALVCGALPAGMTFNAHTGVISGTPTAKDERPVPLRIRMTDSYGWVDSSLLFVVNDTAAPWLAYPEYIQIGVGRKVAIMPTRSGLPTVKRYWVSEGLPTGLHFSTKTGAITGTSVVHDGIIYEPTIMAIGADGKPVASTWVSITIVKPAIPMRVTSRPAAKQLKKGKSVLVAKVRHPSSAMLSAHVTCRACTFTFNKKTGKLVVTARKGTKKVTVRIVGQPTTAKAKTAFAGHIWTRTWSVARTQSA